MNTRIELAEPLNAKPVNLNLKVETWSVHTRIPLFLFGVATFRSSTICGFFEIG